MNAEVLLALSGIITISIALLLFYFPWQTFVVDQTRQRLFEIRDRWFDYSLNLSEAEDRKAAAAIRVELNYLIRLTHHITVPALLYVLAARRILKADSSENPIKNAVSGFKSQAAAKEALKTVAETMTQISWGMARRSILCMLFFPLVALLFATTGGIKWILDRSNRWIEMAANQSHCNGKFA